jgi:hypothetical protein
LVLLDELTILTAFAVARAITSLTIFTMVGFTILPVGCVILLVGCDGGDDGFGCALDGGCGNGLYMMGLKIVLVGCDDEDEGFGGAFDCRYGEGLYGEKYCGVDDCVVSCAFVASL